MKDDVCVCVSIDMEGQILKCYNKWSPSGENCISAFAYLLQHTYCFCNKKCCIKQMEKKTQNKEKCSFDFIKYKMSSIFKIIHPIKKTREKDLQHAWEIRT